MDSFPRYLHSFNPVFCFCVLCLCIFPSLPVVSFVLQLRRPDSVSLMAHLFPLPRSTCQARSAVRVGAACALIRSFTTCTHTPTHTHSAQKLCKHCASNQHRHGVGIFAWPHLDLTRDPHPNSPLANTPWQVCVGASILPILSAAAKHKSETRTQRRPKYTLVKCGCVSLPAADEFVNLFYYLSCFFNHFSFLSLPYRSAPGLITEAFY